MAFPSSDLPRVTFRLEERLRQKLMEAAYKANRSLNAEIIARLEKSFEDDTQMKSLSDLVIELERRLDRVEVRLDDTLGDYQ